jgi:hypothetical protein
MNIRFAAYKTTERPIGRHALTLKPHKTTFTECR